MRFGRKRGQDKLYEQWVERGELSPEDIPQKEAIPQAESSKDVKDSSGYVPVARERAKLGPRLLYILLVVGISLLVVGLILVLS